MRSREPVWSEPHFSEKGRTRRQGGAEKGSPSLVAARGVSMATGFSPSAATFSPQGGAGTSRAVGGALAVAGLPQTVVSETIVRVACERDCCAVLVAARAPLVIARSER